MLDTHQTPRKIIGFFMSPGLAAEVKSGAVNRGMSLRKIFEKMWTLYLDEKKKR